MKKYKVLTWLNWKWGCPPVHLNISDSATWPDSRQRWVKPAQASTEPWLGLGFLSMNEGKPRRGEACKNVLALFPGSHRDRRYISLYVIFFFQMCIVSSNSLLIPAKLFGLALLSSVLVCPGLVSWVAWSYRSFLNIMEINSKAPSWSLVETALRAPRFPDAEKQNDFDLVQNLAKQICL